MQLDINSTAGSCVQACGTCLHDWYWCVWFAGTVLQPAFVTSQHLTLLHEWSMVSNQQRSTAVARCTTALQPASNGGLLHARQHTFRAQWQFAKKPYASVFCKDPVSVVWHCHLPCLLMNMICSCQAQQASCRRDAAAKPSFPAASLSIKLAGGTAAPAGLWVTQGMSSGAQRTKQLA